ncbi:hypothetical protein GQ43DRAFT_482459 [Delitschia confertaspora ATCC 74209]|uniref:Mitochondrial outer membrane translocase complex, subunit Tom5 n=1 Tax=Delitschia confertaspora ATCC 74209 TaxID=1513339 RepID=A0A9P4JHE2_9PLEO|nr:hypothetical protein GQ43DRAFT_482459 [Delitschia confertaspora ATCC 74209]
MFGGPPQQGPSKAEIQAAEAETAQTIRWTATACILLYLSPFAIDYARKLI